MSCGCHTAECTCHEEGLGYLDAITAAEAADTVFPASQVRGTPGFDQHVRDCIVQAAGSHAFACFNPSGCQGVSQGGNIKLIQTGGSLALTGLQIGLTTSGVVTAAALAPFTMGISALIGLFPLFFQHHAQAVALEQKTICAAVPAANNLLQVIDQAVRSGQIDAAHGISALQSLENDFANTVAAILKDDSSHCNAACVWKKELAAIVAELASEYQDMAAAQAAAAAPSNAPPLQTAPSSVTAPPAPSSPAVTPARPNTVPAIPYGTVITPSSYSSFYAQRAPAAAPASSLPSWLPIAAGIALLLIVRG